MKLVRLENVTQKRLVFPDLRDMDFEIGEIKRVYPTLLSHPSIARRLGTDLRTPEQTEEPAPKVEEPKAPESPSSSPAETEPESTEPIAGDDGSTSDQEPEDETAGESLREAFLAGPGITESNVDNVMVMYPTKDALAEASKADLVELGVVKSFTKRLLRWATE